MRAICITLCILFVAGTVKAEIYKYVDEKGVTVFTDNFADVPKNQRKDAPSFKEITSPKKKIEEALPQAPEPETGKTEDANVKTLTELQALNQEKKVLDQEYEELVQQRQALANAKPSIKTTGDLAVYREKVTALNQRIKAFDARRNAFEIRVNAFNAKNAK